jgi:hypothetical protein
MGGPRCATEIRVWAVASGWVFALAVAADLARGPDDTTGGLAARVRVLLGRDDQRRADLLPVAGRLLTLAAAAAAAGWAIQAVTWALGMRPATGPGPEALDYGESADLGVGPDEPWEGRLDRLVALKQQGALLGRSRPGVLAGPADPTVASDAAEPVGAPDRGGSR